MHACIDIICKSAFLLLSTWKTNKTHAKCVVQGFPIRGNVQLGLLLVPTGVYMLLNIYTEFRTSSLVCN